MWHHQESTYYVNEITFELTLLWTINVQLFINYSNFSIHCCSALSSSGGGFMKLNGFHSENSVKDSAELGNHLNQNHMSSSHHNLPR